MLTLMEFLLSLKGGAWLARLGAHDRTLLGLLLLRLIWKQLEKASAVCRPYYLIKGLLGLEKVALTSAIGVSERLIEARLPPQ
jgi:hypothetical protein